MDPIIFDNFILNLAAGSTSPGTTSPALYGAKVGLYGQQMNLTKALVKGDFDTNSMTFGGYSPHAVTWGPTTLAEGGEIETLGSVSPWVPTGTDSTQLAWGYYVYDYANNMAIANEFPNAPLNMGSPLNIIQLTLRNRPNAAEPINLIS